MTIVPSLLRRFFSIIALALIATGSNVHRRLILSPNVSAIAGGWSPAGATWYGSPNGSGSDGGACGYGKAVGQSPISSMIAAGGPSIFQSGKGCGACYQVKCTGHSACSGKPVTVVITDECPGGPCLAEAVHFDMSGSAFGSLARAGMADLLRNVGTLDVLFVRAICNYPGMPIAVKVDAGSNTNYFAMLFEFEDGDGGLSAVDLRQAPDSSPWIAMQQSWGAEWKVNYGSPLIAPFSFRLKSLESKKTLVVADVIPVGWQPGATYRSRVNFMI